MKAYSLDLREKVVNAIKNGGFSGRAAAKAFDVSHSWIKKLFRQIRDRGDLAPLPHAGGKKPLLDEQKLEELRQAVLEKPDATLEELRQKIKTPRQPAASAPTLCRALKQLGLVRKKKGARGQRTRSGRARLLSRDHRRHEGGGPAAYLCR